jgi:hypothetical protein
LAPVLTGQVDWTKATDFHLTVPFAGWFGSVTSLMAGLYLIGVHELHVHIAEDAS